MAEEKTTQDPPEDPFKDFQSEEFDRGELVVAPPVKEEEQPTGELVEKEEIPPAAEGAPKPPTKEGEQPQAAAEGEQPPPVKEGEAKPPVKKSAQERINEVTRARREAERRAEAAEARNRELEARLTAPPKKEEQPPKKEAAAEEDPNAPKPEKFEYGELDSRYIRALASYEANKRFAELRQQDEETRQTRALEEKQANARTQFETMIERGSKVHDDFYEKVVIGSESGKWAMSETLGELVLGSDVGNDVAYHLANNPEEADRIYRSSPVEQARYFGRMEAKFSAERTAASGDGTGKPAPKTPKAPPPPDTARGAGGQFHATADTDDFAAFEQRATKGS